MLLVALCAQTLPACLLPQGIDPIADVPHPAPHFVLESIPSYLLLPVLQLYPQGSVDATHTPGPCHCELELKIPFVEEDDPTVTLEARWFVDYDLAVPSSLRPWGTPETLDGSFDTQDTTRPLKAFPFDADSQNIRTSGVHVVEVVVGEKAGFDNSATAALPNRAMKTGYTAAVYRFAINVKVEQDPARPQCPSELPSLRVCQ